MPHPLDGPWHKVQRAKFHLECLDNAATDFIAKKPYRTYIEVDREHAQKVLWIEVEDPHADFALILGDCIHNLRSALDHFAWQCGLLKGKPGKECQFPIFLDEDEFLHGRALRDGKRGRSGMYMLRAVKVPAAIELIKSVQPYNKVTAVRRTTGLSVINTLSNVDKHRLMPVMLLYSRFLGGYGTAKIAVNFGPYQGKAPLAAAPLDVADEELQLDPRVGATVSVLPSDGIPRLSQGIIKTLEDRCIPAVEALLRSSVELGVFPARP
jgi:hypothetical protein